MSPAMSPTATRRQKMTIMRSPRTVDERHQLRAGQLIILEAAAHGAGGADAVGLANSSYRHARVRRFQDDPDAAWTQLLHKEVGQLFRHALLDLRPPRQQLHDPGQFAQTDDFAVRK